MYQKLLNFIGGVLGVLFTIVIALLLIGAVSEPSKPKSPQMVILEQAERKARELREAQQIKQKQQEDRRRGLHCLSAWDGSHTEVVNQVKLRLRDPASFEHVVTMIDSEKAGHHSVIMKYRARNGFGGMNVSIANAVIKHGDCDVLELYTPE